MRFAPGVTAGAVWAQEPAGAGAAAAEPPVEPADDLERSAREADLISCATLSKEPLIRGAWLKSGAHLDLVGAFTPEMRESDDVVDARSAAGATCASVASSARAGRRIGRADANSGKLLLPQPPTG